MKNEAKITILMPSYNKEKYIAEAIESILMQETTYPYRIIVVDDCSTDKTIDIVKKYQKKYPEKIELLTSNVNQKLYKNILRGYSETKTDYFCVLDPDDYWTDKKKIQKALDFLESNREYTIYATDNELLLLDGTQKRYVGIDDIKDSDFHDFLDTKAVLGHTSSSTYRNVIFKNGIPEKMLSLPSNTVDESFRGDSFRNILHLHQGKVHYVPDIESVYRCTKEGLWQGSSELEQNLLNSNAFKDFWLFFDKKYPELLYNSFLIFNRIKATFIEDLGQIAQEHTLFSIVQKLSMLNRIYIERRDILTSLNEKNLSVKNRIRLYIYKKLKQKLCRKGLI